METTLYAQIAEVAGKLKAAADRVNGARIVTGIPGWALTEILADAVAATEALDEVHTVDQCQADNAQFSRLTLEVRRLENACRDKNAEIRVLQEKLEVKGADKWNADKARIVHLEGEVRRLEIIVREKCPEGRVAFVEGFNAGALAQSVADVQALAGSTHRETCV
jgi:hypothetical protein